MRIAALALLLVACAPPDEGRGFVPTPEHDTGKGDDPTSAGATCLQVLADGAPLPAQCNEAQLLDEFVGSPLGEVAMLRGVRVVPVDGLPGQYVDLVLCQDAVPFWSGVGAPLETLAARYEDAGDGCRYVPAEDFVGVVFLYVHNEGAFAYNTTGGDPSTLAQEAAWRFFLHYPDTITQLFGYDPNFSFSYVNRAMQYHLFAHPELGFEWVLDAVDEHVLAVWGSDIADLIIVNNSAQMMPSAMPGEGLENEFSPPLPNAMARAGLDATARMWNEPGNLGMRIYAAFSIGVVGTPFGGWVAPDLRTLNQIQGPAGGVAPIDPGQLLPSQSTAFLPDDQAMAYRWMQPAATFADFDLFFDYLINHPSGPLVSQDVMWRRDVIDDIGTGRPLFHFEFVFSEVDPTSTNTIVQREVSLVNGRSVDDFAQTAPGAPRGVLLEEMFHTMQPRATAFDDVRNYDNEIEFRNFALDPDNLRALGFHNNPEQIALWRHEQATYEFLRQFARNNP